MINLTFYRAARLWCGLLLAGACAYADVRLSSIERLPDASVRISISGSSSDSVVLQSSNDLKSWQDLQTVTLSGGTGTYLETQAQSFPERSYRLKTSSGSTVSLPDLGALENRVFPAPEGFNTIQYAPDGTLGFIVWRDRDLIYRERSANGAWSEQVVESGGNVFKPYLVFDFTAPREDYRFQPSCVLLFDASSNPHIFRASGRTIVHYARSGSWSAVESIAAPLANADIAVLEGGMGANNVLHLAVLSAGSPRNLTYGTNRGGQWNWTAISTVSDPPLTYWAPPFAARWLALAIDANNGAHIAFRSALSLSYDSAGHPLAYSELKYASNASGQWTTSLVSKPRDASGEAANGASIAIAPDGKPRIVSWYDERADTGSAQESRLYFHQQDAAGNWGATVVVNQADGYVAGDGNKGAGFSPYLRYDPKGVAHILYLDHAGEHFGGVGQQEYAGNLRHAWWNGSAWSFETVFQQTAPLLQESVYPAFALTGAEMAITVLERDTQWNMGSFPPLSASKYYFRFLTKALR